MTLKERILEFINSKDAESLIYLRERWQDEREYEDWKDYSDLIATKVPAGFKFMKATKRPFGVEILDVETNTKLHVFLKLSGKYCNISCKVFAGKKEGTE